MRTLLILAAPLLLGACLEQNLGVETTHKPLIANGEAKVPNCPDWSSQGLDSAAGTDSNYGCATNSNLAAMVANPQDLVHGVAASAGDSSDVAMRTITAWRAGPAAGGGASAAPVTGGPK